MATTDPDTLPDKATWYLATNLPRPGGPHDVPDGPHEAADLAEVVRLYGIRHWIEQSYKQLKDELGWADFQVRSPAAIRRHQTLVNCAFSFCWSAWFDQLSTHDSPNATIQEPSDDDSGERGHPNRSTSTPLPAQGPTRRPGLADPLATATALVEGMVRQAPPDQLQHLTDALEQGRSINLYIPP